MSSSIADADVAVVEMEIILQRDPDSAKEQVKVDLSVPLTAEAVATMTLMDLMEAVVIDHRNEPIVFNRLRTFVISDIVVEALESVGEMRVEVIDSNNVSTSAHFEGPDSKIDTDTCTAAFDYVLRLLLYTRCAEARLIIRPSDLFTPKVALVSLPSLNLAEDVIKIRELNWAFGAPLGLYVQVEPGTTTVDKLEDPKDNAHRLLEELIRKHNFEPRIVTLFV